MILPTESEDSISSTLQDYTIKTKFIMIMVIYSIDFHQYRPI